MRPLVLAVLLLFSLAVHANSVPSFVATQGVLTVATVATKSLGGKVSDINGKVVFRCYAEQCFLSQIWVAGQEYGRSVPEFKLEVKVKQHQTPREIAVLTVEPTS